MSGLSAFLKQNALCADNTKYAASKRFLDEKGEPIEWEIETITSQEDEAIRRQCTKKVQVPGKRGQYMPETDFNLYLGKLAARCTVYPDLDDLELQNSYGVMGGDNLLKAMLTAGEYADYLLKIQEVNGFSTYDEEIDEAKN